jgi:hypothetical protein
MGLLCAFPTLVFAQAVFSPQGGEYAISGERAGDQVGPAVAIGGAGGWVIFQDNGIDRQGFGIAGRRLDTSLNPSGTVFPVNSLWAGDQEKPAIALLNDGGAVAVWQGGVAGFQQVYARFIRPDGSFVSGDVLVSQPTLSGTIRITTNMMVYRSNRLRPATLRLKETVRLNQERTGHAAVATLTDGTVVVAYTSSRKVFKNTPVVVEQVKGQPGRERTNSVVTYVPFSSDSWQDVYFQRFSATGQKVGAEVMVNQYTPFNQRSPAVTALSDGSFLMAWVSEEQRAEASTDVMARRFGSDGSPLGNEFRVSTSDLVCNSPAAASSGNNGFTLVWSQKDAVRTNGFDIYARAYDLFGVPAGEPFRLNSYQVGNQHTPRITSAPAGQMVVWSSVSQDGSGEGVYGRTLNGGTVVGDEFRVNSTVYLRQFGPAIASDSGNRAVVIWSSYQTMAGFDLFGQRYSAP